MDNETLRRKITAGNFAENNGIVIRAINVLRTKYIRLGSLFHALPNLQKDEILDCVNYLYESGYIHLRHTETKAEAVAGLADMDYRVLEGKLTGEGIRLLAGGVRDDVVKV